jgi:hypothetical protein
MLDVLLRIQLSSVKASLFAKSPFSIGCCPYCRGGVRLLALARRGREKFFTIARPDFGSDELTPEADGGRDSEG